MAATSDASLFEFIENADVKRDVKEIIERSILIKKAVVEKDEKEEGLRKVLNFGHTVGHAIESAEQGKLLHGECVATGMLYACSDGVKTRLENLMTKFGLPVRTEKRRRNFCRTSRTTKKRAAEKSRRCTSTKSEVLDFLTAPRKKYF